MKVYDSYSQELEDFIPINNKTVKMYVCGPTVYDYPHLGHARCYITWDMVSKYLRFKGYKVTYVRNITDVDDKIINKARSLKTTPEQVATKYYAVFKKAMQMLNVADPDIEPKATDNIDAMIEMITNLIDNGFAYAVNSEVSITSNAKDVYFRVKKFNKYGRLSKQSIQDLEVGARIDTSVIKEEPLDFALWKAVKTEDELGWDSPWGKGRPGWHIECSAMASKFLSKTIDIHAGGQDLLFPHHENEIAQSECANGVEFAKYWLHNGFVTINSEKMSKSLGNFVTIENLLEKYDSNTIRFFILTNHYRMPVEFNDDGLKAARAGVKRLKNAYDDIKNTYSKENIDEALSAIDILVNEIVQTGNLPFHNLHHMEEVQKAIPEKAISLIIKQTKAFTAGMDDDFNTSKALAVLFDLAGNAQKTRELDDQSSCVFCTALLIKFSDVLGFDLRQTGKQELSEDNTQLTSQLMDVILSIRTDARTEKNWALSDKIRDKLQAIGITLKDNKDGTNWSQED